MASSSSSPAAAATAAASFPVAVPTTASRRPPPPCWTHDETLALIHSYSRCYLSLRRAALRAPHWQEISVAVAARCLPSASPKTPIQCRHKVEKLRKRLRCERRRSLSLRPGAPPSSSWPYFSLLDSIDPLPAPDPPSDDDGGGVTANGGGVGGLRFEIPKAVRSQRTERRRGKEGDVWGEMASALMKLGDGFLRVEQMKMEMARETERRRMEMQLRRTEMMLDSQRRIVDALVEGMLWEKRAEAYPDS
ncbi:putative transcription factor Trihelix family [Dioscorea sansibarensis]